MKETKWNYINNTIISQLQNLNYKIEPYKINYLKYVPHSSYPKYFYINESETYKTKYIKPIKSPKDLIKIYDVNNKLSHVLNKTLPNIKANINIETIDNKFFKEICTEEIFPSEFSIDDFPKSSCISVNNVVCHGIPYKYNLKDGDIVTIDVCGYNGYHSDMAETIIIGKTSGENKKLVETTKDCLYSAISICKPGIPYSKIGPIVEKIAVDNGFDVIKEYGGHGIGKFLHMKPHISNYSTNLNNDNSIMKIGDMFSIEPLVKIHNKEYINKRSTFVDKDGFSVLTLDRKNSAHFERTILITDFGHIILNDII